MKAKGQVRISADPPPAAAPYEQLLEERGKKRIGPFLPQTTNPPLTLLLRQPFGRTHFLRRKYTTIICFGYTTQISHGVGLVYKSHPFIPKPSRNKFQKYHLTLLLNISELENLKLLYYLHDPNKVYHRFLLIFSF